MPYLISVCRYFGLGTEESFEAGDSGANIELDGFGLFLSEFADYVQRSGDQAFFQKYRDRVEQLVLKPLLACRAPNGLMRADSGPWERYLDFKQFTYTSVVCATGLLDWAKLTGTSPANGLALKAAIEGLLFTPGGWLKGNFEAGDTGYDSHDGGTFEAYAGGLIRQNWAQQLAEYYSVLGLPGRGYSRINEGDSYETAEWVLLDMRVASALARMNDMPAARRLLDWVTSQAAANYGLIPEVYRRDNAGYDGQIPIVGFGAGAYVLALFDVIEGKSSNSP